MYKKYKQKTNNYKKNKILLKEKNSPTNKAELAY